MTTTIVILALIIIAMWRQIHILKKDVKSLSAANRKIHNHYSNEIKEYRELCIREHALNKQIHKNNLELFEEMKIIRASNEHWTDLFNQLEWHQTNMGNHLKSFINN